MHAAAPGWLAWARYSVFVLGYPVGIVGEWWLVVLGWRGMQGGWKRGAVGVVLIGYVAGAWVMFRHMLGQRRRVLGRGREA